MRLRVKLKSEVYRSKEGFLVLLNREGAVFNALPPYFLDATIHLKDIAASGMIGLLFIYSTAALN